MLQEKVTIAGKEVGLAYCYATEIAFHELTGKHIAEYIPAIADALGKNAMPDIKDTSALIMASAMAYEQGTGKPQDLQFNDLVCEASPTEFVYAAVNVLALYTKFYNIPTGEPQEKKKKKKKKKA